jgi:hypothetical protein
MLKNAIHFPSRYIGSKSWSLPGKIARLVFGLFCRKIQQKLSGDGIYQFRAKTLSKEEVKKYIIYCSATMACFKQDTQDQNYSNFGSWIDRFGFKLYQPTNNNHSNLPGSVQVMDRCYFDPRSGLKAVILYDDNEVILCFGSNRAGENEMSTKKERDKMEKTIITDATKNLLGAKVQIYAQADALFQVIKQQFKDKKIVLTGQCFGGSLASYVALKNQVCCIGFNTLPLGVGQQQDIGKDRLNLANKYCVHISAKGDYLSDFFVVKPIDRFLCFIGIRTPGIFGVRYKIPSAYKQIIQTHIYIMGSIMHYLGYPKTSRPAILKNEDVVRVPIEHLTR